MAEAPVRLSPSTISTFRQCPQRFKFEKIDKLGGGATEDSIRGNFVHDVLEALLLRHPSKRTREKAKALARELWDEKWRDPVIEVIGDNPDKLREFRQQAWWRVENYFGIEDPAAVRPAGLETHVEGEVAGVVMHGFIDRWTHVPGGLEITDYKTGKTPLPQYREDKWRQLFIYADLLAAKRETPVVQAELLFLKDGKRLTQRVTQSELDKMRSVVAETRVEIDRSCATEVFETRTGPLCNWCNFKPICPAWT